MTTEHITDYVSYKLCNTKHNKYDLYSKSNVQIDVEKVKPYYMSLIKKVGNKTCVMPVS